MPKRPKCMDKDRYEKDAFKIQMEIDEQKVRNGSVGCEQTLHIAGWANPGRGYLPGPQWGFVIYRTCYDEFVTTHSGEVMRWDDIRTEIESIATYQLGKDVARGSDPHKRLEALRFLWVEDKDKFNEMSVDQVQKHFNAEGSRSQFVVDETNLRLDVNPICLMVDYASAASITRPFSGINCEPPEEPEKDEIEEWEWEGYDFEGPTMPPPFIWAIDGFFTPDFEQDDLSMEYHGTFKVPIYCLLNYFWAHMFHQDDTYIMEDAIPGNGYYVAHASVGG